MTASRLPNESHRHLILRMISGSGPERFNFRSGGGVAVKGVVIVEGVPASVKWAQPLGAYRFPAVDTTGPLDGEGIAAFLMQTGFVIS